MEVEEGRWVVKVFFVEKEDQRATRRRRASAASEAYKRQLLPFIASMAVYDWSAVSQSPACTDSAMAHDMLAMASGARPGGSSTEYILMSPDASLP